MDSLKLQAELEKELQKGLQKVDRHMRRLLQSENKKMQEVMDWILGTRGKLLRPRLLLVSARLGSAVRDATEYAAILEIVHMASLVHDDVVDEADMRRGKLSVQKKFGKSMAVYSGDFMIFSTIGNTNIKYDEKYRKFYGSLNKLCNGELDQNSRLFDANITAHEYIRNITNKTASMFELACELGAMVGEAGEAVARNAAIFGKMFGILFQIRDDLLDFRSQEIGKPTQQDFMNGIYTLPVIYSFQDADAREALARLAGRARGGSADRGLCAEVEAVIRSSGGFKRCYEKAAEYYREAGQALKHLPEGLEREYLQALLDELYQDAIHEP